MLCNMPVPAMVEVATELEITEALLLEDDDGVRATLSIARPEQQPVCQVDEVGPSR